MAEEVGFAFIDKTTFFFFLLGGDRALERIRYYSIAYPVIDGVGGVIALGGLAYIYLSAWIPLPGVGMTGRGRRWAFGPRRWRMDYTYLPGVACLD